MKTIVCIKQVPNTTQVRIDPVTHNLVRTGIPSIMNPYDQYAVKKALLLREKCGGTITVITMGPTHASDVLQEALAMGVDEAYHLCDRAFSGADTLATGYTLSHLIAELGFDLILCGAEAIDGCTGQVGPSIAENLGIPQLTNVRELEIHNTQVIAVRETSDYLETYTTSLPLLVCLLKGFPIPFHNEKKPSSNTQIHLITSEGFDETKIGLAGSPTQVVRISTVGNEAKNTLVMDPTWPLEKRLDFILCGGIEMNPATKPIRGTAKELSELLAEQIRICHSSIQIREEFETCV